MTWQVLSDPEANMRFWITCAFLSCMALSLLVGFYLGEYSERRESHKPIADKEEEEQT